MATQNTILGTLNWAAAFTLNRPSQNVAQAFQEPGLTIANLLMSTILAPPFAWQWNRKETTFTTTAGQSDYTISIPDFGWLEKATYFNAGMNPPIVELTIVSSLSASGKQNPPFQIAPQQDDNAGNITFRLLSIPDNVYTITLTYQKAPILATSILALQTIAPVTSISINDGLAQYNGSFPAAASNAFAGFYFLSSRYVGGDSPNNGLYLALSSNATSILFQNPNVVATSNTGFITLANTWAPIPDKYNFLYERGMLAHLHAMYDSATYLQELSLFFRQLVGCSQGLSDTQKAIFLEDKLRLLKTEAAEAAAGTASPKRGQ